MLAATDFTARLRVASGRSLLNQLREVLPFSGATHGERPEVAGQVMTKALPVMPEQPLSSAAALSAALYHEQVLRQGGAVLGAAPRWRAVGFERGE